MNCNRMKEQWRRAAALGAAALIGLGAGAAENIAFHDAEAEETIVENVELADDAAGGWELDENGFLLDGPGEAYLVEDEENGIWQYADANLAIVIRRFREEVTGKKKKTRMREYCVAEIRCSENSPLESIMTSETKKRPAGYKLVSPELLAENQPSVFAMSDDLYGIRLQKYKYDGVVIRNGEIIARKTRNSAKNRPWPNLDTMAVYEDGSMKTYICDAMTPEEYLERGARQVFSFGPVLISEGVINEDVLSTNYYYYEEPRAALGMVEPWHYVAVMVRGRPKDKYAGVQLDWLAEKMKEYGCTEALNLDGGETVTMMFNGKIILTGGAKLRSQGSMIAFGLGQTDDGAKEQTSK